MKAYKIFLLSVFIGYSFSCSREESNTDMVDIIVPPTTETITITTINVMTTTCSATKYPNAPEQSWFSFVNGTEEESHGHYILTCSDGGFLQVGETGFIPNSAKILVVKTDSKGNLEWKKEFSNGGHNLGNSAIEVTDGYLISGALNEDSALIKLNKLDGALIFRKTYDNGGSDAFEHVVAVADTLIAVGYVNAMDRANTFYTEGEGYLTFLNTAGDKLKGVNVNAALSHAYRIQAHNNALIISGLTEGAKDYGLIKTDNSGNIIWQKTYGGALSDHCFGMDLSADGSIFLTGHTLSGTENWDTYTMKIDTNGNQVWETKQGNPRGFDPQYIHDETWGIKATADGGCIIVAGTGDEYEPYSKNCGIDSSDIWHVYLIKFDALGRVQWQKTYSPNDGSSWAGEDIDLTPDGGAIIAVDNGAFGFLKINPF